MDLRKSGETSKVKVTLIELTDNVIPQPRISQRESSSEPVKGIYRQLPSFKMARNDRVLN